MLKKLFKISRPRFWLYLAGPFLIGAVASDLLSVLESYWFYILLIYFLIFANIYLYGINDYFDYDTDKYNIKKEEKESKLNSKKLRKLVFYYIIFFLALSFLIIILIPNIKVKILLALFLFLASFYSAPPLRFKRWPIIDSLSNILYIIPGLVSYFLFTKSNPDWFIILALWAWAVSMHLFSAIPDIKPDKKAGLYTTAIFFGEKKSLWICSLLWMIFSLIIIINSLLLPLSFLFLIYPLIPLYLLIKKKSAEKVYWHFPFITGVLGFLTFWYLFIF